MVEEGVKQGVGKRGGGGWKRGLEERGGRGKLFPPLHCPHQNDSAIIWAAA